MITLPRVSSEQCVRALLRGGLQVKLSNEKGTALWRDGRVTIVPARQRVLTEAELRLILRAAHLSWEEFAELVERESFAPKVSGVRMRVIEDDDEGPMFSRAYVPPQKR